MKIQSFFTAVREGVRDKLLLFETSTMWYYNKEMIKINARRQRINEEKEKKKMKMQKEAQNGSRTTSTWGRR